MPFLAIAEPLKWGPPSQPYHDPTPVTVLPSTAHADCVHLVAAAEEVVHTSQPKPLNIRQRATNFMASCGNGSSAGVADFMASLKITEDEQKEIEELTGGQLFLIYFFI